MMMLAAASIGVFCALVASSVLRSQTSTSKRSARVRRSSTSLAARLGAGVVAFFVLMVITGTSNIAVPMAVVASFLPVSVIAKRRAQAQRRMLECWPDALRSLRSSLLAGRSLHAGLLQLVHSGPVALRPTMARYQRLAATIDQTDALEAIRADAEDPFVDRIVEVLMAATEAGPATVLDIIDDLADAAIEDLQLRGRVETAGLEQTLNAGIIMAVPILMLLLVNATSPMYRSYYAGDFGFITMVIGLGLGYGGYRLVKRLATLPSEPRIFDGAGAAT